MDRGPWQAAVYKVTKSWKQLKGLSMLHTVGHEKLGRSQASCFSGLLARTPLAPQEALDPDCTGESVVW